MYDIFAGNKRSDPDGTCLADDVCNSGNIMFTLIIDSVTGLNFLIFVFLSVVC